MAETKSPLKDKPLRNPGQSVREQRFDLAYDKILAPILMAVMMGYWAIVDWVRYFFPSANTPWISTAIALGSLAWAIWQFKRTWPKVRMLRLAEEGEKAVGQYLETLRASGYLVFHDLVGTDFNVDHVVIGPAGVFTIETKTWKKPSKGSPKISFDGETLLAAGYEPDRNPVIQAKAQSSWLKSLLAESTGKLLPVKPVVLFPGWFVDDSRSSKKDIWLLEPKAFIAYVGNEKSQLAPEDVKLAAFHLSRFIREQERTLEEAT